MQYAWCLKTTRSQCYPHRAVTYIAFQLKRRHKWVNRTLTKIANPFWLVGRYISNRAAVMYPSKVIVDRTVPSDGNDTELDWIAPKPRFSTKQLYNCHLVTGYTNCTWGCFIKPFDKDARYPYDSRHVFAPTNGTNPTPDILLHTELLPVCIMRLLSNSTSTTLVQSHQHHIIVKSLFMCSVERNMFR